MKGEAAVTVLLLPGMDGTGRLFDAAVPACPRVFRPEAVRLPNDRALSYEELAQLLSERIAGGKEVILAGESFSGPLVLKLAARGMPNVKGVVLINSFIRPPHRAVLYLLPWRLLFSLPLPLFIMRQFLVGREASTELAQLVRSVGNGVPSRILTARIKEVRRCNVIRELQNCAAPVLAIHSKEDRLVRPHNARVIRETRPGIDHCELIGPHLIFQTHPEETWGCIESFARKHGIIRTGWGG